MSDDLRMPSFAGIPFQQGWGDLEIWEHFLHNYPCRSIVELGTGQGGMAIFFATQAHVRGARFSTFDREQLYGDAAARALGRLGAHRHLVDVFERADYVRGVIEAQDTPVVLFCDNGDKPREVRTFAPSLSRGDYLAVHDWNAEIRASDMPPGLEELMGPACDAVGSITRFFRVR
jgi:cephalosporin hydroxylase